MPQTGSTAAGAGGSTTGRLRPKLGFRGGPDSWGMMRHRWLRPGQERWATASLYGDVHWQLQPVALAPGAGAPGSIRPGGGVMDGAVRMQGSPKKSRHE